MYRCDVKTPSRTGVRNRLSAAIGHIEWRWFALGLVPKRFTTYIVGRCSEFTLVLDPQEACHEARKSVVGPKRTRRLVG
jgi:hypothetical protein